MDSEGTTIDDGRNLGSLTTTNIELELTADCYTIVLTDTANDGGARVTITDDAGTQLFRVVGNWGGEKLGQFTSNGVLGTNHNEMGIIK